MAKTKNPALAGRLGGLANAKKYGKESAAQRGSVGGTVTRTIHGSAFYSHIRRLGHAKAEASKS